MNDPIEDELKAAFAAAAAKVTATRPVSEVLADFPPTDAAPAPGRRRPNRRWLLPAVAATATILIAVPAVWIGRSATETNTAAQLQVAGNRAAVAGVSFPVPDGWQAQVTNNTADAVRVCVAAEPTSDCADGVSLTIAVVGATFGGFDPVPDPILTNCQWIKREGDQSLGGRPATAVSIDCSATGDGPRALAWYLQDGSLSITTPPAVAAAQAREIAAGMDLSQWANKGGTPVVVQTSHP
ncbi:hypothetical protein [Nakamurella lactea]|uniref:hypothetical protein n=1 Tax=Nakamurella lactea TaxID=459515 RepID=UPI0004004366|nr:hypothetical protein [Nakamurella lactea]